MIYLDHTSTCRLYPEVASYIKDNLDANFANPAAAHSLGLKQEHLIKDSLASLAKNLGCKPNELIVTSGATEATNTAIFSTVKKLHRKGKRIITTAGDHEATTSCFRQLKQDGFDAVEAPLTRSGTVNLEKLAELITDDTILISFIHVSNEVGSINDIDAIVKLRNEKAPHALIHVDCVQSWTKISIHLKRCGVDFASFSGHKIHAPKGIGLLYVREKTAFAPLLYGGGQQSARRSGTENPLLLAALALAADIGTRDLDTNYHYVEQLNRFMRDSFADLPLVYNSPENAIPHILNISFPPARGETLLHILANREIYLSTTSACSTAQNTKSHVLQAMGAHGERLDSALRISLAAENSMTEIETAVQAIREAYEQLAAIGGRR